MVSWRILFSEIPSSNRFYLLKYFRDDYNDIDFIHGRAGISGDVPGVLILNCERLVCYSRDIGWYDVLHPGLVSLMMDSLKTLHPEGV